MKKQSLLLAFLLGTSALIAQTNKLDKKMEKAYDLVDKAKYSDADEYLEKLLDENPGYGAGWDYLAKVRYQEYKDSKLTDGIMGGNFTITTTDKDGNKVKGDDSLAQQLTTMLTSIKPSKKAFNKYVYTMRQGTLLTDDSYNNSYLLRAYFVDTPVDTAVSKKALKYFNQGEEEFGKKNYEQAAKYYKRAIDEQPDFYKASLYMGDCFYYLHNYADAITSFKSAVAAFPNQLEPRKYLIDAYAKEKLYSNSLDECVEAMKVYPDYSIFVKMDDAAYLGNKKIDIKWMARQVFPNKIDDGKSDVNDYKPEKELKASGPWTFYKDALAKIKDNCNEQGLIIKPSGLTKSTYLEVYSWEEMLKNSSDASLDEARKMQKDGYLDCYVLVTCFHYDIYDQYANFAAKNSAKISDYYKKYIVSK